MSRLPSAETMLKSERRINKALRTQLADAIRSSGEYRHRATKAEQEAADWKRRFDALLAREPQQLAAALAARDALRIGMDEALFALYPHQPAVARELRMKYLPDVEPDKPV